MKTLMILSTYSTTSLEDVAAAAPDGDRWFNTYIFKDRSKSFELIKRAERAGFKAIVVSCDIPTLSKRRRYIGMSPLNQPGVEYEALEWLSGCSHSFVPFQTGPLPSVGNV
jgi:isopentenyl diphosphate isomerase/L-lactate dehydrogenase-like FMN-dependent dehydrogenase